MRRGDLVDYAMHHAMRALPMTVCSDLGALLSPRLAKRPHPAQHANARALFSRLRPEWAADEATLEAAADRLWANVARTFAEFAVSHRMLRAGRVAIEGRTGLEAALAAGRPIVAIFPHLGNWELSEMQFGFLAPHRGAVIVAPPADDARARIAHAVRSRAPAELLPMSRTVWKQALARLKAPGGGVMIAIDEEVRGVVMGPRLNGGPPRTDGNLGKAARLALMTGALVVPFYNERLPRARFVTHVLPAMTMAGAATDPTAVAEAVARMEDALRPPILRLIDQWYMAIYAKAE